jgi:sec-independent protein translocase protein TatA
MFGKFEELLVILLIVLILFGGKKLPELAKSIGESVREVRRGINGEDGTSKTDVKPSDKQS